MRLHQYLAARGMEAALNAQPPLAVDDWRALAHLIASELWTADPDPANIWPAEYCATLPLWTDAPPARVLASLARLAALGVVRVARSSPDGAVVDLVWVAGAATRPAGVRRSRATKEAT